MKTNLYLFGFLTVMLFMSCKSVQTLVDSGNYDAAIALATKKMRGAKGKKTKHIKALEKAFIKVNNNDLEEIAFLNGLGNLDAYERILDISERIAYRQKLISPYLPLISKDGYQGHFDFVNANDILVDAGNSIKELSYNMGVEYLALAKSSDDNKFAREAYYAFLRTSDFDADYNDVIALRSEAEKIGIIHVLVETLFDTDLFLPYDIANYLDQVRYIPRSDKWIRYYDHKKAIESFDFVARLKIDGIDISPERENKRIFFEEKEVEDGDEYVLDKNGNVAKDTLGNDIKRPKYSVVKARIKEIFREKSLSIRAQMELFDTDNETSLSQPISAEAFFEDSACIIKGDRRALSENTRKRVKDYPLDFPSDLELLLKTGDEIKQAFRFELSKMIKRVSA